MKLCVNFNSKKEFLHLIFWIFVCNFYNKSKKNNKNFYISESISQICLVIFFLYQIFTSKKRLESEEIFFSSTKKPKNICYKITIVIIFIIFVMIFDVFKILTDEYTSTEIVCNIDMISVFLIDRFFFKKEIRPHHLISIIITSILSLYNIISNYKFTYLYKILKFCLIILNSYSYIFHVLLINYISNIYYVNIYFIGFLIGIFELISHMIKFRDEEFKIDKFNELLIYPILLEFYFFLFYYNISKFGPIFTLIVFNISIIMNKFKTNIKINLITLIISLISSLIYLELIELNFCGLNKYLSENIIKRGENEMKELKEIELKIEKEENDNENNESD